jgi:hypothetical protein
VRRSGLAIHRATPIRAAIWPAAVVAATELMLRSNHFAQTTPSTLLVRQQSLASQRELECEIDSASALAAQLISQRSPISSGSSSLSELVESRSYFA